MIVARWLIACLVVFGGLAWAARLMRRMTPGGLNAPAPLARLGALSLGPRRTLVVVRVGSAVRSLVFHEHGALDLGPVQDWPRPEAAPGDPPRAPGLAAVLPFSRDRHDWLERVMPKLVRAPYPGGAPPGPLEGAGSGEDGCAPETSGE